MNVMTHKGYFARIEFDAEDEIFVGHIAGIRDTVGFHADTVAALKDAFAEALDDYLETCRRIGKEPERPASGKFMVRIDPEVHARAVQAAELSGTSLAKWSEAVLAAASLETILSTAGDAGHEASALPGADTHVTTYAALTRLKETQMALSALLEAQTSATSASTAASPLAAPRKRKARRKAGEKAQQAG